ncbi:MAG: hypothetical protein V2A54_17060 [Bacteroidota bacterium]
MKTKIIPKILLILLTVIFSCNKDKWKEPTTVGFVVDINRTMGQGGKLNFTKGNIVLGNFIFDGDRVQGDDVYFSNNYSSGLNISFDPSNVPSDLNFDIPQGTFTKIDISFTTSSAAGENQIVVEGNYKNSMNNNDYPIRFEFKASQTFSITSQNANGNSEIILKKDVPVTSTIFFDPVYWFQPVSQAMLNNADMFDVGGVQTIVISDICNISIYSIVANRIGGGSKITF